MHVPCLKLLRRQWQFGRKLAVLRWGQLEFAVSQNPYESPSNPDSGPIKRMPFWEAILCGVLVVLIILTLGWTLLSASTEARKSAEADAQRNRR